MNAAIQSHCRQRSELNHFAVQHWQSAGHAEAHGTYIRIWRGAKARRAGTKDLGRGQELHVNFEPDDRFEGSLRGYGRVYRAGHTRVIINGAFPLGGVSSSGAAGYCIGISKYINSFPLASFTPVT